jgi:hypothetical protein
MPHVSEAIAASHDDHDLLLVAAFAAGDLTGAERDLARSLTTSCGECAALHADLVAIARATATLPPPIASAGRDFRLSPAQAASLRRTGWRRLLPASGTSPLTRPLGVALATFGIAGLLISNVSLGTFSLGSGAPAPIAGGPAAAASPSQERTAAGAAAPSADLVAPVPAASAAASAAAAVPAASAAAPSEVGFGTNTSPSSGIRGSENDGASAGPGGDVAGPVALSPGASGGSNGLTDQAAGRPGGAEGLQSTATAPPSFPLAALSLVALLVGVVLIVVSLRSRRTTA